MKHGWITEELSAEIAGMRATTRAFVQQQGASMRGVSPREIMPNMIRQAAEHGLTAADIPVCYGGIGLNRVSSCHVAEELVREASFAVSIGVHVGIGMWPTLLYGSETQRSAWLPRIADARTITAYALTEPSAGSNAMGVQLKVTRDGSDFILNGQKLWITNAGFADLFTVFGRLPEGIIAFLVPAVTSGVSVGSEESKMGLHGSSTATVFFEDVRVPQEQVLGDIGRGHKIAFGVLNLGRLKLAAGSVGMARQALQAAAQYAAERPQFANRIIEFPAIREKLARMAARLYAAESLTYAVAAQLDAAEAAPGADQLKIIDAAALECSVAKVVASETCGQIVDDALQVFGGIGYSSHTPIERIARDCRVFRIFEGTTEVNSLVVIERFIHRHGGTCTIDEHCRPGHFHEERHLLWDIFRRAIMVQIEALQGSRAFLGSVHVPNVQERAWALSQLLIPLLTLEAMAARNGRSLAEAAMSVLLRETQMRFLAYRGRLQADSFPSVMDMRLLSSYDENDELVDAALALR